ncbi:ATP-binding protein [Cellulomonas aerilata]|uniref:HTH cro/C1-type domain-containing protein n=1 Tax=Cellulomonas aerilata TaxID=515326 RepID=A0A512D9W9_9CELL|nr:helix-turn-helix domain-containing protein [Cellulomonas aerilata]GEO33245.1 hypothetical protein CAE01nite_09700 [Cellulomonas aerilata]
MARETGEGTQAFAAALRTLRERAGLTQEELAGRAGLTAYAVSALERGTRTHPYPHTVRSLADALDLAPDARAALIAAVPSRRRAAADSAPGAPGAPGGPGREPEMVTSATSPATAATQGVRRHASTPTLHGRAVHLATPPGAPRRPGPPVAPAPAAAAGPARPSATRAADDAGLAVPATPLFGRDDDIAAVTALVRAGSARLVTLTGPGGVGKTRLAAAVSDEVAADGVRDVRHVALASLTDAAAVVPAIGRAVGATGADGPAAFTLLVEHLRDVPMLLVLDNAEHLLSAAADVVRLVGSCPDVTVLVTSRSPLRVRGEQEYPVAPLALPPTDAGTPDALAAAPAGALVLARARAVSPAASFDVDDVRALACLCERLAGLPLAIELATARLRFLSPRALLDRLDDATSASGARDLPPRQRTMRATLDWSYGLLSAPEQTLFRALAVCRAGATIDVVERIAELSGVLERGAVLAGLEGLVEQSLVVVRTGPDGAHRYDMLAPVAQYARALLVDPEAERLFRAHIAAYLELAERAATGLERAEQVLWLARTEADEANLLVAIDRALDLGESETAGRITWAMWLYWWLRGQYSVGRRRAEDCLCTDLSPGLLGRAHLTAATMAYAAGDVAAGTEHWTQASQVGEQLHDRGLECTGRAGRGLARLTVGDLESAETELRRALDLGYGLAQDGIWITSLVHVWLGTVQLLHGDPHGAAAEMERGLALARGRGDLLTTYVALFNLAQARVAAGDPAGARTHLREGVELAARNHDVSALAYLLDGLAGLGPAPQGPDRVAVLLGAAQALRETVGTGAYAYLRPDGERRAAAEQAARAALGADAFDDALDAGRALSVPEAVTFALQA